MTLLQEQSSDVQQIDRLLDVLVDSKEPFRERQLGGGPWQVPLPHLCGKLPTLCCACALSCRTHLHTKPFA